MQWLIPQHIDFIDTLNFIFCNNSGKCREREDGTWKKGGSQKTETRHPVSILRKLATYIRFSKKRAPGSVKKEERRKKKEETKSLNSPIPPIPQFYN